MKKKLWILVACTLLLVQLFSVGVSAEEPVASGSCGDSLSWELNTFGTLTISGTGNMTNYFPGLADISVLKSLAPAISEAVTAPWSGYTVKKVVIEEGVTSIGSYAFYNNKDLLSVTVPEGVTTIGIAAFANCTSLMVVSLPRSLTSMGVAELSSDTSGAVSLIESLDLKILGIPVTTIAKFISPYIMQNAEEFGAFTGCTGLLGVNFSEGLKTLGVYAFSGCTLLTSAVLPQSLTSVNNYSFNNCSSLFYVKMNEGLSSIGSYAFYGCKSLKNADIPSTVTSVAEAAFKDCSSLSSVTLPDTLEMINANTFGGCTALKEIVIPQSVNEIGEYAFNDCTSLSKITFEGRPQLNLDIDVFSLISGISLEDLSGGIDDNAFYGVTADAYYYMEDDWSGIILNIGDARKDYGGALTWKALTRHETFTGEIKTQSSYKASAGTVAEYVFRADDLDHNVLQITLQFPQLSLNMYGIGASVSIYDANGALVKKFTSLSEALNQEVIVEGTQATVRLSAGSLTDASFALSSVKYTYYVHTFEDVDLGILSGLNLTSKEATCTESGYNWKHCSVCNKYVQDKFPAKGHDFGSVTYQWSDDYSTCTATHTCKVESCKQVDSETVETIAQITQNHSVEANELTTYTAVFENSDFEEQVISNVITRYASGWFFTDGNWYYKNEDKDGTLKTGWLNDNGTWYFLDYNSGAMATGWLNDNGTWYFLDYDSGAMAIGWVMVNGSWYYFNTSGAMATGWLNDNGTWYYLQSSGAMQTGWLQEGETWYFLDYDSGAMATGWKQVGNDWYYFNTSGVMQTGWLKVDGKTYYLNSSGAMQTGRIRISRKYYTFGADGALIA